MCVIFLLINQKLTEAEGEKNTVRMVTLILGEKEEDAATSKELH
jgi:hypothetical protein